MEANPKEELVRRIIEMEWKMFDAVHNIGGRADCQDDWETFSIMRRSQLAAWDRVVLESYCRDLLRAEETGANLVERKYAYMMQFTDPEYYDLYLAPRLPPIATEDREAVDRIAAVYARWYREAAERFPAFVRQGVFDSNRHLVILFSYDQADFFHLLQSRRKHGAGDAFGFLLQGVVPVCPVLIHGADQSEFPLAADHGDRLADRARRIAWTAGCCITLHIFVLRS